MATALRMQVRPTLEEPILFLAFEGWNDAGDAASGALRFLDAALCTAPLGEIDPEEYYDFTVWRPAVRQEPSGGRRIEWPSFRLRYGAVAGRGSLITGLGGEPHLHWRSFCDEILTVVKECRVRRALLLGAFMSDVLYSLPVQVTGFSEPPGTLAGLGVEATHYEGPTGIVGVLAERLAAERVEVISLWAGLPHYISVTPNPRGTLALVQATVRILDLPVDQEPLRRQAAEFEGQVSKLVAEDPALAEYVRQLKRREFAQ